MQVALSCEATVEKVGNERTISSQSDHDQAEDDLHDPHSLDPGEIHGGCG